MLCATVACGSAKEDTSRTDSTPLARTAEVGSAEGAAPAPGAGGRQVLIIGTSLTAGYGLEDPSDAYPAVMQRMADSAGYSISVQNGGLSGETSAGALRRVDWLLRTPYDVVVVETGANDGLRGLDVDSTRANLRGIIAAIRQKSPGARIALVQMEAPPNMGVAYTTRFHETFGVVAREAGVTLLPFILDGVAGVDTLNQRDGIHPNPKGARIVAANLWQSLAPLVR